tara:strand:+ start:176 stop:1213 length:1038 start_codon:yes stop_codon:yes gene_type:complete
MFLSNLFIFNFFLIFVIFVLNYKYRYSISKKLKIIDIPDNKRKLHKNATPLNGAFWFLFLLLLFLLESFLFEDFINDQFKLIIISSILIFIVGFIDDRKSINANLRLILYFVIFYFVISFDEIFQLKIIYFESLNIELKTYTFATFFSAFCITAFINSINLTDGINALANTIIAVIFLLIFLKFDISNLSLIILLFFLILNIFVIYKGKYFLGDSGSLSISAFVGLTIIYYYNSKYSGINVNIFNAEDIFVLMAFPGLDMIRVFFERFIRGKNPFHPTREHLHHLLLKKHSLQTTLIIYIGFAFIPSISNFILQDMFYTTYNLFSCIILYIVLLKYSRRRSYKIR